MARRKDGGHGGGHGWFVTFADLMGLLVAFFVMLVAYSTQDQQKLQIVAGPLPYAFGLKSARYGRIIEPAGLPARRKLKTAERIRPEDASNPPAPDQRDHERQPGARLDQDRGFALAAASLRQALDDLPDLAEL